MCLPPHASHVLQPLDAFCYEPFKQDFKIKSGAMHVTKVEFMSLLKKVWENSLLAGHLQWFQMLWSSPPFQTGCIEQQADPGLKSDDKRKVKYD